MLNYNPGALCLGIMSYILLFHINLSSLTSLCSSFVQNKQHHCHDHCHGNFITIIIIIIITIMHHHHHRAPSCTIMHHHAPQVNKRSAFWPAMWAKIPSRYHSGSHTTTSGIPHLLQTSAHHEKVSVPKSQECTEAADEARTWEIASCCGSHLAAAMPAPEKTFCLPLALLKEATHDQQQNPTYPGSQHEDRHIGRRIENHSRTIPA